MFRVAFAWATEALGLPAQEHFADPAGPLRPDEHWNDPPALNERHGELTLAEVLFAAGRQAALHRPWNLFLYGCTSSGELGLYFMAACLIIKPELKFPADMPEGAELVAPRLLHAMTPEARLSLVAPVARFFAGPATLRLPAWRKAQDLISARAGLLMCGDLDVAKRMLARDPKQEGDPTLEERMKDLASFAVTRKYVALRARLGIGVKLDEWPRGNDVVEVAATPLLMILPPGCFAE